MRIAVVVAVLVLAAAAFFLGRSSAPSPAAGPPVVQVDPAVMEAARPELARPSLGQKLATRAVKPDQVQRGTAPSPEGRRRVAAYCEPVVLLDRGTRVGIAGRDSASGRDSAPKARTILPDFAGRRAGARLELHSTLNDGTPWQGRWTARGRIAWESSGDTVLVRGDRLWIRVVRGTPRCAATGAAGGAIGALAGQDLQQVAVTGLVTALACAL